MKQPRVRFTVRRMIVAVAILAVVTAGLLEAVRTCRRMPLWSMLYKHKSNAHAFKESVYRRKAAELSAQARGTALLADQPSLKVAADQREMASAMDRLSRYEEGLKLKYRAASSSPWWPVPHDPPEPAVNRTPISQPIPSQAMIDAITRRLAR